MTAPTATPQAAFVQLRRAEEAAGRLAALCDEHYLHVKSLSIDAYGHGGGSASVQLNDVACVDQLAQALDMTPDNPDEPWAEKRADGLSTLYTRRGKLAGMEITAYCRRP